MTQPTAAELVRIYSLRARGLSAEAIAARLGLDLARVREALNPKPITRPEGMQP